MSKPYTIEFVRKVAKSKKGKCLSKIYKNQGTKLKFQCSEGHIFYMAFGNMLYQKQWCSKCSKRRSEEICRYIFETLLKIKFNSTSFTFKGHTLELDGYNDKYKIAFEYNGRQHYEITGYIKTKKKLKYRKYLDNLKKQYCKSEKIKFIVISYTIKNDSLLSHIISILRKLKIKFKKRNININKFIDNYSYYKKRKQDAIKIIKKRGGKLLKFGFDTMKIKCNKGHIWEQSYIIIKYGHWCKKCSLVEQSKKMKGMIRESSPLYKKCKIKILNKSGIICLSAESKYKNGKSKMKFKCENGHIFEDDINYIIKRLNTSERGGYRKICPHCLNKRQNRILSKIEKHGLKLVNPLSYKNRNIAIEWICENGHKQKETLKNISARIYNENDLCFKCR